MEKKEKFSIYKLNVKELKEELLKRGIQLPSSTLKAQLITKLEECIESEKGKTKQ